MPDNFDEKDLDNIKRICQLTTTFVNYLLYERLPIPFERIQQEVEQFNKLNLEIAKKYTLLKMKRK